MNRRLPLGLTAFALALVLAACQPIDGGASGSPSAEASTTESDAAAPTDAPAATPSATAGTDYSY
jgi:hypothetical protein